MHAATYALEGLGTASVSPEIARHRPDLASKAATASSGEGTDLRLQLDGVSLSFGGVTALDTVDLAVRSGEIRAIIGPNGAGKSSLINVISGVYRPDHGRVLIAGKSYAHVPTAKLARLGIARTFQNLALFKGLSVLDNVVAGRAHAVRSTFLGQIAGVGAARREEADARDRARRILAFLHLEDVAERHRKLNEVPIKMWDLAA